MQNEIDQSQLRTQQSYERIPYRTFAWTSCQPARLETVARLWGVAAAPADHCRIIELGCGDGGNLIPLAIAHPDSEFVGIDLAPVHVEAGNALIEQLALTNVELRASSFVDVEAKSSGYDYVIAHGLMSWITPELQELLFANIGRLLSPHGIAFVSYNTYPGWYMQHAIRELLRHHNKGVTDVDVTFERSQKLLDALVATVPGKEAAYREYLESIGSIARNPEQHYYFVHEYLEDENHPFYVRDFIERAGRHGLGYLGDADLVDMELDNMPAEASGPLERLSATRLGQLQALDYAVNRKFRQSLLCHASIQIDPAPDLSKVEEMFVFSSLQPDQSPVDLTGNEAATFSDRHGRTIEVDQPLVKAALDYFARESPAMIAFADLVEKAGSSAVGDDESSTLAAILGRLFLADMIELQVSPPCWATEVPERPRASPLVRLCAEHGQTTTSLRHRTLDLENATVCEVLRLLDGSRTRDDLVRALEDRVAPDEIDGILTLAASNGVLCR